MTDPESDKEREEQAGAAGGAMITVELVTEGQQNRWLSAEVSAVRRQLNKCIELKSSTEGGS